MPGCAMRNNVASAYDELRADHSLALDASQVRAHAVAHYTRRTPED